MRVFNKERKKNNIQKIERPIYENNNNKNKDLNMLFQPTIKQQESSESI